LWWSLRNADKVIAISECTKNDIIRFYGTDPSKIELVYLDGDTELLELEKNAERIIPEKYFFAVSTHPKRKNIISVIEAISRSKKLQEYTFVLAGKIDTVQLGELNALINKLRLTNIKLL
jgi:glycosyltransferase involved in cell wall biosynthesis